MTIITTNSMPNAVTMKADAALIIQSVNGYAEAVAALRMLIAWEDNTHDTSPAEQHRRAVAAARAVVAKAEG